MTENDFEPLCKLLSDPKVMKYLEAPYSEKQTEQFLSEAGLAENPLIYAVEKDKQFIGYVIYHSYDKDSIEIGWVLYPYCWGQGIASVLTEQMLEENAKIGKHTVIECVPEQKSTIRIAEKFGFINMGAVE